MLQQLFTLFRDTKWITAVSLVLSLLLYFPAQICELYRAILADRDLVSLLQFYTPLVAIGLFVWFGANQVALESAARQLPPRSRALDVATWLWPATLGVLPLLASAIAQYQSIPSNLEKATAKLNSESLLPGSAFYKFDEVLAELVGEGLKRSSLFTFAVAIVMGIALAVVAVRFRRAFSRANRSYFARWRWLGITIAAILAITWLFVSVPVAIPQRIGTFTLIALFALLIVAFCIHISLATIHFRFPYLPIIFVLVLVFSWADLTTITKYAFLIILHRFRLKTMSQPNLRDGSSLGRISSNTRTSTRSIWWPRRVGASMPLTKPRSSWRECRISVRRFESICLQ